MAGSKKSNDISPLEKWRQTKDKVLNAEDVDPSSATKPATAASGDGGPTYIPIQGRSKGEATMLPGQAPNSKGEATMLPGQAGKSKGGATMLPGQAGKSKGGATMLPGQAGKSKGEATMVPGKSRTSGASEPKIIRSGTLRRRGAGGKMMPGSFRPSKSQATMLRTTGTRPKLSADARAIASTTIKTFIKELRSIASRQGMDFSTEQPDTTTVDFLTRSKMLRVSFTGREIDIDRIVLIDNGRLRVAPVRSGKSGVFDWDDSHPPEDLAKVAPNNRIAIEAHYVNTGENRDCRIELVNRPSSKTGGGGNLTPDGARRLVMLLLDSLSSSAGT